MRQIQFVTLITVSLALICSSAAAQSGGDFEITRSVIAGGGGDTAGGTFGVSGTKGQPKAGTTLTGGSFSLTGGFWHPEFGPTSALVSVTGRVSTAAGVGIRNVTITITAPNGSVRRAVTGSLGFFRFDEVEAGGNYVITVNSRRYRFPQPTRVIQVVDNVADVNFIALD